MRGKQAQLKKNKGYKKPKEKYLRAVSNATIFMKIPRLTGPFSEYLWKFTNHKIIHETGRKASSGVSDQISKFKKH